MSTNAISANPEHYVFKIFQGSMPPDPLEGLKNFSRRCEARTNFLASTSTPPPPPQTMNTG